MSIDLGKLLRDEDVGDALFHLCELEIQDDPHEPVWFTVDGSRDFTILARDGSGGVFITVGSSPRIIYASSEGECGVVGSDIGEFLALVVTCPYWRYLLHSSGSGRLEEMRRAYPVMEAYWRDERDDNEAMRERHHAAGGRDRAAAPKHHDAGHVRACAGRQRNATAVRQRDDRPQPDAQTLHGLSERLPRAARPC
jgi:hypothetical protein